MDIVQRLICVVLLICAGSAVADEYTPTFKWRSDTYSDYPDRDTYQEVLEDNKSSLNKTGANYQLVSQTLTNAYTAAGNYQEPGSSRVFIRGASRVALCLYGGTLTGSNAQNNHRCINAPACPEGQTRQSNGACTAPPVTCTPGCNGACGSYKTFKGLRTLACIDSCIYKLGAGISVTLSTGETSAGHDVRENTGATCEGVDDSPTLPTPCPECECQKQGKSWGTVNGLVVCHSPGTPGSKPVTKQDPPQTKTETPAPTPENPNPEPVTTETPSPIITITPNPAGGSPDITETTTNPDGSTSSTTQSQESYCQKNPTASVCKQAEEDKKKGSWSGSCGAFQCEGDAVNCAIARKIHQDRCDDLDELKQFAPAAEEGRRILMGEEDESVTGFLNRDAEHTRTINLANEIKESGDYQFAAQCFSDVQINIGSQSITVPFSKLCSYFEMIGYILLAASYLWALRIVGIF